MRIHHLPELDITGMWVVAIGVWFHIFAHLVRKQPDMAMQLGEAAAVMMVVVGGYKILNRELKNIDKKERDDHEIHHEDHTK